jgi:hypothetical protein
MKNLLTYVLRYKDGLKDFGIGLGVMLLLCACICYTNFGLLMLFLALAFFAGKVVRFVRENM